MSEPGSGEGVEKRVSNAELLYGAGMSVIPSALEHINETITSEAVRLQTTKLPFSRFDADVRATLFYPHTVINVIDPNSGNTIADLELFPLDSPQDNLLVLGSEIDTYLHEGCGVGSALFALKEEVIPHMIQLARQSGVQFARVISIVSDGAHKRGDKRKTHWSGNLASKFGYQTGKEIMSKFGIRPEKNPIWIKEWKA